MSGATPTGNAAYNNFSSGGEHVSGGGSALSAEGQSNFTEVNNVLIGGLYDIGVTNGSSWATTGNHKGGNNNLYDDLNVDFGDLNIFKWQTASTHVMSTWQSDCSCDGQSLLEPASQINADGTGHLLAGSKGIGLGQNLSDIAIGILAPLAKDKNGVTRPSTGAWDVGAYVH